MQDDLSRVIFDHAGTIDVIMSDWSFEDQDFADLTKALRQQKNIRLDKIPCIISTGIGLEAHKSIHDKLSKVNIMPLAIMEKPTPTKEVFHYLPF